jgi:hypothetical protein
MQELVGVFLVSVAWWGGVYVGLWLNTYLVR